MVKVKDFDMRNPEKHIERVTMSLEKRGVKDEKEKALFLVRTFKKGDTKVLYRGWVAEKSGATDRTGSEGKGFVPTFKQIAEWLISVYGKPKVTYDQLRRISKRSKKQKWSTEKFRNKFCEAYERRDSSISEREGSKLFGMGLRPKVRDILERNADLYDSAKDVFVGPVPSLALATMSKKVKRLDKENKDSEDYDSGDTSSEDTSGTSGSESESDSESEEEVKEKRKGKERKPQKKKAKGGESSMEELTEAMKALSLAVRDIKSVQSASAAIMPLSSRPMRETSDKPKNCYVCDSTEHLSRACPVFDEMVRLGWPLKRDKGMIVVRDDDGTTHDIGHGYGRGGVARVLVKDYPQLQKKKEVGNVRMAVVELVDERAEKKIGGKTGKLEESSTWARWAKKHGVLTDEARKEEEGAANKVCDKEITVDASGWGTLHEKMGVDGKVQLNVFMTTSEKVTTGATQLMVDARVGGPLNDAVRLVMRAKGVDEEGIELARMKLEMETGYNGPGVMPLRDLIGRYEKMSERDMGIARVMLGKRGRGSDSGDNRRKEARLESPSESSPSSMSVDEEMVEVPLRKRVVQKIVAPLPKAREEPSEKPQTEKAATQVKPKDVKGKGRMPEEKANVERAKGNFKYRSPIQEERPDLDNDLATMLMNTPVQGVCVGHLLAMPGVRKKFVRMVTPRRVFVAGMAEGEASEGSEVEGGDEMDCFEAGLKGIFGDTRYTTMTDGDVRAVEIIEEREPMEEPQPKGNHECSSKRNDPRKWPEKRPLLSQSPHLTEVELVSLDNGLFIPRVPNDDGSQMNLVARGLAEEIEKRGISVNWDFKFNMRSANGTVDELSGLIPNIPVFVGGVRFEISALVVADSAPFALLWGSPANQSAGTRTVRDIRTKEMTVRMVNPEGYSVYYTAIEGYDPKDVMVGDDGKVYKGVRKNEKEDEMKKKMREGFSNGLRVEKAPRA
ncbi:hypothetical protein HDU67_000730 [Dinochytrium kinnereticum]|nr:hypothetical protein HDU67_000730 [Dinochytrium kinnereticum]